MPEMNNMKVGNDLYEVADPKSRGVSLTWAQYQALSYEEQHNGTAYYITDMDAIYPVDHELNANSRNAVANDIVTPHILAMENVLGAKNVLPNDALSATSEGITWTVHSDGTISASGTASANGSYCDIWYYANHGGVAFADHILSGAPEGADISTYRFAVRDKDNNWAYYGAGDIQLPKNVKTLRAEVAANYAIQETITFKPMIRPAGTDPTYVPYAMTNEQLTGLVIKRLDISLTIPYGVLTGTALVGVNPSRIVGIVLRKNDDVYYNPIIYSMYDSGYLEAQVLGNTPPSVDRTYNFYINYI